MRIVFVFMFACAFVKAHSQNQGSVVVEAGKSIKDALGQEIFLFPEFKQAKIKFRNGNLSSAKVNYHLFVNEFQFLHPQGDTLAVANPEEIHHILIGTDSFYFDKDFVRLIRSGGVMKLGVKESWRIVDRQKEGAYGTKSSTSASTGFSSISDSRSVYNLSLAEDLVLKREVAMYIGNEHNHFIPLTKKNLLNLFSKNDKSIKEYLDKNNVKLNDSAQMITLVDYFNAR